MMEVYLVKHHYDTDGGFGDAVACEETVAIFSDRETAEKFVECFEYHEATVYDKPYAYLTFGEFTIESTPVFGKDEYPTADQIEADGYWCCLDQLGWYKRRTSKEET